MPKILSITRFTQLIVQFNEFCFKLLVLSRKMIDMEHSLVSYSELKEHNNHHVTFALYVTLYMCNSVSCGLYVVCGFYT